VSQKEDRVIIRVVVMIGSALAVAAIGLRTDQSEAYELREIRRYGQLEAAPGARHPA
jgi:hypothetical protein